MRRIKDEKGMVIVEATMVFPIMFLVLFFLIYVGNSYLQKCRIRAMVTELTVDGAAYCANPMLRSVDLDGVVPGFDTSPEPYRYFFGMNDVEELIQDELKTRLENMTTGLFSGMRPSDQVAEVEFVNGLIYATFRIELDYKITVPVKLIGADDYFHMRYTTRAETPVTDVPEFMRNINMIEDYMEQSGITEIINDAIEKAKEVFVG